MAVTSTLTVTDIDAILDGLYLNDQGFNIWNQQDRYLAIRAAIQDVYDHVSLIAPDIFIAEATISYVSGTVEYSLPTDFGYPLTVFLEFSGSPPTRQPLSPMNYAEYSGNDEGWYIRADKIGIAASATSGTVKLSYVQAVALPTTLAAKLNLPDRWVRMVPLRAAIMMKQGRGFDAGVDRREYELKVAGLDAYELRRSSDAGSRGAMDIYKDHFN